MSHPQQREFLKTTYNMFSYFFENKKVLEVGSLNINGTVRDFFKGCDYTGIDVGAGKDVDIVCSGHIYDAPTNSFDTVISCECFEHNPYWEQTFANMYRMCKPHGLVIFTCATEGRPEHGTSRTDPKDSPLTIGQGWEYYRNLTEKDFRNIFNINQMFLGHSFYVELYHFDLYFWGIKK